MATVLVVGANRGIGLELCRGFVDRGDTVLAACRTPSESLQKLKVEILEGADIAQDAGLAKLVSAVGNRTLDTLVVVAGILGQSSLDNLDVAAIRQQFEVNALAPLRVVAGLQNRLANPAKVALLTSRMGSVEDNTSGGYYAYRMSKAALNMAGRSLSIDLKPRNIAVALLHPGFVKTDMTGGHGDISAADSAAQLIKRIDAMSVANSGTFWHAKGETLPW